MKPVATIAFVIAIVTGAALLATKATAYIDNPFLLIKFPAIALGMVNAGILTVTPAWRESACARSGPASGDNSRLWAVFRSSRG